MYNLGRLTPKTWKHVETYPFSRRGLVTVDKVEKIMRRPALLHIYVQQNNGCTGFSSSWMTSINNSFPTKVYDANWLYYEGTKIDLDPQTSPENDAGGYIWAVMEILRTQGHSLISKNGRTNPPNSKEGIQSYYWCTSVDEMRTAISLNRPIVFGINWYEEFSHPVQKYGGHWIGTHNDFGELLGGHAICCYGARDSLQAFRLVNSWGMSYPPVWISYNTIERLMKEYGESCVAMDL